MRRGMQIRLTYVVFSSSFHSHIKAVEERPHSPAEQEVSSTSCEEQRQSQSLHAEPARNNVADALRRYLTDIVTFYAVFCSKFDFLL